MKRLRLERHAQNDFATYGNIIDADTRKELCVTLELPDRGNQHNVSCIPVGTYLVKVAESPKRGYPVPWIQQVPNRDDVQMHRGVLPGDTDGCVLLGTSFYRYNEGRGLTGSHAAFDRFMEYVGDGEFELTIVDATQESAE